MDPTFSNLRAPSNYTVHVVNLDWYRTMSIGCFFKHFISKGYHLSNFNFVFSS